MPTASLRRAAAILLPLLAAGCQMQFVSAYDDVFDHQVAATQMDVDSLLTRIAANPSQSYQSFAPDYAKIGTDFDALSIRAGISTHNADTQNSVERLRHSFQEFQNSHATSAMSAAAATGELRILNHEFQILMAQEMAKKSGQQQG